MGGVRVFFDTGVNCALTALLSPAAVYWTWLRGNRMAKTVKPNSCLQIFKLKEELKGSKRSSLPLITQNQLKVLPNKQKSSSYRRRFKFWTGTTRPHPNPPENLRADLKKESCVQEMLSQSDRFRGVFAKKSGQISPSQYVPC